MSALLVVVADPLPKAFSQSATGIKRAHLKVLMLDGPPQPLDEDVILAAAPAVHADGHVVLLEYLGEGRAGELSALVGIEDFRRILAAQGLVERFDTKGGLQRIGDAPT